MTTAARLNESPSLTIDPAHPLRQQRWVWPNVYMYLHNHFAQFRWDFDYQPTGNPAVLYITADKSYRLYVNGTPVCRGPARGYQQSWPFDEVDIASLLRPGKNWISVEAYQPGCSTFQYLHENYAGLLMATASDALRAALAAGAFAMRRSPGHRRETARYSFQIDFQEHLDLRLDDRRWITAAEPPIGWVADVLPARAQKLLDIPFGRPPYNAVEPRGIPLLRETVFAPQHPIKTGTGRSAAGYREATNVSWHWVPEGRSVTDWGEALSLKAATTGDALRFTVPPTGVGGFRAVVIPTGWTLGTVAVTAGNAAGGEIIDFQHDQAFRDGNVHFIEPGDASIVALGNRLILRPGDNAHEFFHPIGFGVVTAIFRDLTTPLDVSISVRRVEYPLEDRGTFDCSDSLLNEIHAACRRTQQLCASDAYIDTPWREQAQWWGDARVQAKNTFYLDGDARLLARGVRNLAVQDVLGLTPGHAPTSSYWCVLPDFALTWVLTLWDHYWQTGSPDLFREQYDRVKKVLAYFDTPEARHRATGLLRHDGRFWLFEDWADLPKEAVPTFLNLWFVYTLRHLSTLCEVAGLPGDAAHWAGVARSHAERTTRFCFDAGQNAYRPALREDGSAYGPPSVHDQTLAIMLGLEPQSHRAMIERFTLPYLRGESLDGAVPSSFWSTYVLEQAIGLGFVDDAVAFIKLRWEPMLSTGTTWEDFKWDETSPLSCCHAWSAHPSYHLVNALAGITQTEAGWTGIDFRPHLLPGLDHATATVPSPVGPIYTAWRRVGGKVEVTLRVPRAVSVRSPLPLCESNGQEERLFNWTGDVAAFDDLK